MTSTFVQAQRATQARNRRDYHRGRIAAVPAGSRRQLYAVWDWLRSEVAAGGDLQELIALAEAMNRRASDDSR
jgi:hypothetical protein